MSKRRLVEYIVAWVLIIIASTTILLPLLDVTNISRIFIVLIGSYGIIHLIKFLLTLETQDKSGLLTALSCIIVLLIMIFLDISDSPWNLALVLFIWIILMSLVKLKESDFYHDRKNRLWKLNIVNLILFIFVGILTTINLYYTSEVQILVLGFFFLINGILELMDPLVAYITEKK